MAETRSRRTGRQNFPRPGEIFLTALIGVVACFFGCARNEQKNTPTPSEEAVLKHDSDSSGKPALDSNLSIALAQPEIATQLTFHPTRELDTLPAELWTLTNLRELNLSCLDSLLKLPPEIGQLRFLERLVFDCGNSGSMNISLPEEIGKLKNLTVLRLYGAMDPREVGQNSPPRARFKHLPEAVRNLTGLKELNLGRNGLPYVPPQIASLENLEILDLSFNEIHELPEFVGNLKRLRELSLEGNGGIRLPASTSQIKGLKVTAGNNHLDLKNQDSLRQRYPDVKFDFENEFDDCAANEPVGGYPEWQKKSCGVLPTRGAFE